MSTTVLFICLLNYFLFEKTKAKFFTSICKKWTIFYSVYVGNLLVTVFAIKSSFFITISLFDVIEKTTSKRATYKTTVIRQNPKNQ